MTIYGHRPQQKPKSSNLGYFYKIKFDPMDSEHRMIEPETTKRHACYGEIHRLAPQVKLSKTSGRWREPLVVFRGSSKPTWQHWTEYPACLVDSQSKIEDKRQTSRQIGRMRHGSENG